jgi:hypothetical protein
VNVLVRLLTVVHRLAVVQATEPSRRAVTLRR